ncbi:MAG: hypothetical protein IJ775_01390 [Muribaculaceae bacterium]|nr:hypothetical protein [Muribaculaceae bacterium]
MKTTRNMMMSILLAGSMVLGASFASAQSMSGRQRPTTSNSSTTSVSRSSSSSNSRSAAAQSNVRTAPSKPSSSATTSVQRQATTSTPRTVGTSRPSTGTTSTATRSSSTVTARPATGTTTTRPSTVTARPATSTTTVTRSSMGGTTATRPTTSGDVTRTRPSTGGTTVTRPSTGGTVTTRSGNAGTAVTTRPNAGTAVTTRPEAVGSASTDVVRGSLRNSRPATGGTVDNGSKPDNKGNGNKGNGNNNFSDNRGKGNRGGGDVRPGGNNRPPVARPEHNPYRDDFRRNYDRGNWSRPLPPPARPYRPAPLRYYRPVVPVHYRPYAGAPVIDRILGLRFGSLFDISLNYLYTNNYYIDGYDTNIIYLRDVRMLNLLWPDVMLSYDSYGALANAQFVISTGYADRSRYNRLYHDLCAVYGPPISVDSAGATWFGGNTTGYVTLSAVMNGARFYTTLSVGY